MLKSLLTARLPRNAIGVCAERIVAVEVKRRHGAFALKAYAQHAVPPGLLTPSFHRPNISDEQAFIQTLWETAESAGLLRKNKWSLALPEGCCRSSIVTLEGVSSDRSELREMIEWKAERLFGLPSTELRISSQPLKSIDSQARFLITAIRHDVIGQYVSVFTSLDWNVGMILPQHLAESLWLGVSDGSADALMVASHPDGFMAIVLRAGEPILLRWHTCDESARLDELYRFLLYYRDNLAQGADTSPQLRKVLVLGSEPRTADVGRVIEEALDVQPEMVGSDSAGLECGGSLVPFSQVASAAGLASSSWMS